MQIIFFFLLHNLYLFFFVLYFVFVFEKSCRNTPKQNVLILIVGIAYKLAGPIFKSL